MIRWYDKVKASNILFNFFKYQNHQNRLDQPNTNPLAIRLHHSTRPVNHDSLHSAKYFQDKERKNLLHSFTQHLINTINNDTLDCANDNNNNKQTAHYDDLNKKTIISGNSAIKPKQQREKLQTQLNTKSSNNECDLKSIDTKNQKANNQLYSR